MTYDLELSATISIGGRWEAETLEDAVTMARLELRHHGEMGEESVNVRSDTEAS